MSVETDKVQQIPLTLIDSPSNAVRELDETSVLELSESVKAVGVLQSILVRPKGKQRYEIVFGNHRFHAAQKAGLREIPCRVAVLSDSEALLLSVTENIQRLEMNPFREGEVYASLLKDFTFATLASRLGKSTTHIQNRVLLASKLCPELRVEVGVRLTLGQALAFCKMPFAEQKVMFERIQAVRAEMVNGAILSSQPSASPSVSGQSIDPEALQALEQKAKAAMNTCFECGDQMREDQTYRIEDNLYCPKCAPFVKRTSHRLIEEASIPTSRPKYVPIETVTAIPKADVLLCPKCGNPLKEGKNGVYTCGNPDCSVIQVKFLFIRYDSSKVKQITVSA
jgi:ParB/RepB/Spo0J family partition protein